MKRSVFEKYIFIQYFKPQFVTGGLVFMEWLHELQSWDRLEIFRVTKSKRRERVTKKDIK